MFSNQFIPKENIESHKLVHDIILSYIDHDDNLAKQS